MGVLETTFELQSFREVHGRGRECSRLRPTTGVYQVPCHDEFRGPRSEYVRQVALATKQHIYTLQYSLLICYKQTLDNACSVAFSPRANSPRLIEDDAFNDSDIINNLSDYKDGQEEPDSL
ncbi:hypothetical protein TNCV_3033921 [Trichonephila clavipes]|nr:hypothetical protein TNCV_3033921 [Trichonephila clavipes]